MPEFSQAVDARVYSALTTGVALIDPGATGILELIGDDAAEFLQGQVTNDIQALDAGQGAYAGLLSPKGQMRADMRVLNTGDALLVLTDAALLPVIRKTIDTFRIGYRFESIDRSDSLMLRSLVGPRSREMLTAALGELLGETAGEPISLGNAEGDNAKFGDDLLAVTTILGVDLLGPPEAIVAAERALHDAGAVTAGLEALELARIERGVPRFGAEISELTIPQEADLNERAVSFTKGCYVGQETVARLHYKGKPNRHLRGLSLDALVQSGAAVTASDGRELGHVGGVVVSPSRGVIALAVLRREAEPGDSVDVGGVTARVTDPGLPS